ncbi:hypothetical protein [Bilophila wadsworthia]|uniref:hypothetical protein n=1 Tax=Bilophila wadsworthia TaxID=35833 RepID=UPI0039909B02
MLVVGGGTGFDESLYCGPGVRSVHIVECSACAAAQFTQDRALATGIIRAT